MKKDLFKTRRFLFPELKVLMSIGIFSVGMSCSTKENRREQRISIPENMVAGSVVLEVDTQNHSQEDLKKVAIKIADETGCQLEEPARVSWSNKQQVALSKEANSVFALKFTNCDMDKEKTTQAIKELAGVRGVMSAEGEALVKAVPLDSDPYRGNQTYLDQIKRDEACKLLGKKGKEIVVAVVDTGVDVNHPDLKDAIYRDASGNIIGANFVGKGSSRAPDSNYLDTVSGHGTHVAGIVGATSNNRQGVAGVAACANVKIMPVRVLGNNGSGSSLEIDRGIQWAADQGADIINLSLGYNAVQLSKNNFSKFIFNELARKKVIVLAAAGNDGFYNGMSQNGGYLYSFPASYDNVISVAATNSSGDLTNFSVFGERIDIAAPGQGILATHLNKGYSYLSGTSMATPVVAGSMALALSLMQEKVGSLQSLEMKFVESTLSKSILGAKLAKNKVLSGGVIDVNKLVASFNTKYGNNQPVGTQPAPVAPVTTITPAPTTPSETFNFVGLIEGQKISYYHTFEFRGLPKGTKWVAIYWGDTARPFTYLEVAANATTVKDSDMYHLMGTGLLKALAVSENGQILARVSRTIQGY